MCVDSGSIPYKILLLICILILNFILHILHLYLLHWKCGLFYQLSVNFFFYTNRITQIYLIILTYYKVQYVFDLNI